MTCNPWVRRRLFFGRQLNAKMGYCLKCLSVQAIDSSFTCSMRDVACLCSSQSLRTESAMLSSLLPLVANRKSLSLACIIEPSSPEDFAAEPKPAGVKGSDCKTGHRQPYISANGFAAQYGSLVPRTCFTLEVPPVFGTERRLDRKAFLNAAGFAAFASSLILSRFCFWRFCSQSHIARHDLSLQRIAPPRERARRLLQATQNRAADVQTLQRTKYAALSCLMVSGTFCCSRSSTYFARS